MSMSFPSCSTHFIANASSVNLLLEARARFRISIVASSDIESASVNLVAYSDSVLAWYPSAEISKTALKCRGDSSYQ